MRPAAGTNVRVIARLDIKGPNLVKGIHFEGLRVLGKPEDFARRDRADCGYGVSAASRLSLAVVLHG